MTVRLLLLVALAGGIVWVRAVLQRARTADERRGAGTLPVVPAALRGGGAAWIVFTTPTCVACRTVTADIARERPDDVVVRVDATTDPDLAQRWDVRRAPTTLRTDADGRVLARLVGAEAVRRHLIEGRGTDQGGTKPSATGAPGASADADSEPLGRHGS
jgi:hypothetical protein